MASKGHLYSRVKRELHLIIDRSTSECIGIKVKLETLGAFMSDPMASTIDDKIFQKLTLRLGDSDEVTQAAAEIELKKKGDVETLRFAIHSSQVFASVPGERATNPNLKTLQLIAYVLVVTVFLGYFIHPWQLKVFIFIGAAMWARGKAQSQMMKSQDIPDWRLLESARRGHLHTMKMMTEVKSPECLAPLLQSLIPFSGHTSVELEPIPVEFRATLVNVLRHCTAADFIRLDKQDKLRAYTFLDIFQSLIFLDGVIEVLRLVEESVDLTAFDRVLLLSRSIASHHDSRAATIRATEVCQVLMARQRDLNVANSLLRPAYAPDDRNHLLRPAGPGLEDNNQLLRPAPGQDNHP